MKTDFTCFGIVLPLRKASLSCSGVRRVRVIVPFLRGPVRCRPWLKRRFGCKTIPRSRIFTVDRVGLLHSHLSDSRRIIVKNDNEKRGGLSGRLSSQVLFFLSPRRQQTLTHENGGRRSRNVNRCNLLRFSAGSKLSISLFTSPFLFLLFHLDRRFSSLDASRRSWRTEQSTALPNWAFAVRFSVDGTEEREKESEGGERAVGFGRTVRDCAVLNRVNDKAVPFFVVRALAWNFDRRTNERSIRERGSLCFPANNAALDVWLCAKP